MSVRAGGAEEMFLDVKELAVHKLRIRKTYVPGSIDFHSAEIKQVEPLEVTATAELLESQIRIEGNLDTEIGFYQGSGLFLADVIKEQVLLALPVKVICQSDCRGLCPNCGANLNHEECRCETHATDPRMAPLARLKQDWLKKQ